MAFECKIEGFEKNIKINAIEEVILPDTFIKLNYKDLKAKHVCYENAVQFVNEIKIQKGDTVYCNLTGKFIFGDFIAAFIQENNLDVELLTILSLSASIENVKQFEALIHQGWVDKIDMLLSEYFLRTEQRKSTDTLRTLKSTCENNKGLFNVYYSNIHSKIILIKTKKGGYVTISGSANLRSSQSLEQIVIQENKEIYDFNYNYYKQFMP